MGRKLTSKTVKLIYRNEVLQIRRDGEWMGLSSLANIFNCPVVSVCPEYGANNTRQDLYRIFYPFKDWGDARPVYIMWTNINGIATERDFSLNQFTPMLPFVNEEFQISDSEPDDMYSLVGKLLDDWTMDDIDLRYKLHVLKYIIRYKLKILLS